tara:strand:- start:143 stop:1000 length:858 start_codon:yes stop_codon:yes gene_type:complete
VDHSSDGSDKEQEWIDDVVARAVERSLENSPAFNPSDDETPPLPPQKERTVTEVPPELDSEEENAHQGEAESLSSPYPDEGFSKPESNQVEINDRRKSLKVFLEWGAVILGALLVAFLIKTFLMQAYYIPSSSMTPTLQVGDRVLVNKLSYKVGDIGRGDLIVFQRPTTEGYGETDLIKRVVALEGELIEIIDGRIYITESSSTARQLLVEPYLATSTLTRGFESTEMCEVATETSCLVPDDHLFVLGDNRNGSRDSRYFGPISEELVVGRAFIRLWPISSLKFL